MKTELNTIAIAYMMISFLIFYLTFSFAGLSSPDCAFMLMWIVLAGACLDCCRILVTFRSSLYLRTIAWVLISCWKRSVYSRRACEEITAFLTASGVGILWLIIIFPNPSAFLSSWFCSQSLQSGSPFSTSYSWSDHCPCAPESFNTLTE